MRRRRYGASVVLRRRHADVPEATLRSVEGDYVHVGLFQVISTNEFCASWLSFSRLRCAAETDWRKAKGTSVVRSMSAFADASRRNAHRQGLSAILDL